jgi:hypothetical protein
MRKTICLLAAATLMLASCSKENEEVSGTGKLAINASVEPSITLKNAIDPSVVNSYNLTITNNSDQSVKYNGTIASVTSPMELPAGTYTAVVTSEVLTAPAFNKPAYGVSKNDISIASNQTTEVALVAKQTNSGVKVAYAADMATNFAGKTATTTITDANGSLLYASDESHIGYFTPGAVTVKVTFDGKEYTQSVNLEAGKNKELTVNIAPKPATPNQLALSITATADVDEKTDNFVFDEKPKAPAGNSLKETFDALTAITNTNELAQGKLASFPETYKAFNGTVSGTLKIGSSKALGYITSIPLTPMTNGNVTVAFDVAGSKAGSLKVTVGSQPSQTYSYTSLVADGKWERVSMKLTGCQNADKVKIEGTTSGSTLTVDNVEITY